MTDAPVVLTAKQKTALARIERQDVCIARIETANNRFYEEQAAEIDLTPTLPERKPAFTLDEDQTPYLKIGEFVKVENSSSPRCYRPEGYGYVTATFGVGIAAYYSIKYTPAFDGGSTHKQVQLGDLTPCSPFDEFLPPETKRARKSSAPEPELVEEAPDERLPIQKLCDALVLGTRKQKGWHRRTLGLGNRRYLSADEEQQLSTELMLLEQHLAEPSVQELGLRYLTE